MHPLRRRHRDRGLLLPRVSARAAPHALHQGHAAERRPPVSTASPATPVGSPASAGPSAPAPTGALARDVASRSKTLCALQQYYLLPGRNMPHMRRTAVRGGRRGFRTALMVSVARERMENLVRMAAAADRSGESARSRRYVGLARKIGMRYNVRMSPELRGQFCSACNTYLRYGVNTRSRLRAGRRVVTCVQCGQVTRLPFSQDRGEVLTGPSDLPGEPEPALAEEGLEEEDFADEEAE